MLTMNVFLALLSGLLCVFLVLITAIHPQKPQYSLSEVRRRGRHSKEDAFELRRQEARPGITILLRTVRTVLLVLFVGSAVGAFGWGWGIALSLVVAVAYPVIARIRAIRGYAQTLYRSIELPLIDFIMKFERAVYAFREPSTVLHATPRRIFSQEDLAELIQNSKDVISADERQLLSSAMTFFAKEVSEVMTPKSVINFIKKSEFLGPLVLDELHALGHSRLPVINKDLDHIVGVLHIRDLLSLDVRESTTAEQAMEKKVFYIHENDTLEHALAAFLKTRHHLFIVINENRETVGLLTLEDVMEALIGRKIMDEDDIHEDLRAVAAHEGKTNNAAPGHVDL